ncbi:MAG: hypothetical protein ACKPJD_15985 [Planctomycetaceae bacterium]
MLPNVSLKTLYHFFIDFWGFNILYTTDECEYDNDGVYDQFFETAEQLWEYAQAVLPPLPRRTADQPVSLPILQAG